MNFEDYMARLALSLSNSATSRVVSRSLKTVPELEDGHGEELQKGRFTVFSTQLTAVRNIPGCAVQGGTWIIAIVGQIMLAEGASGEDVERAEFALFADLVTWLNGPLDPEVNCLEIQAMSQSQQLEKPYGWIAATIEVTL